MPEVTLIMDTPFVVTLLVLAENLLTLEIYGTNLNWKKGRDPHPQDKIRHLDFTKDARPLYYKTPPCVVYHKNVRSKAVFGP